MYNSGPSKKIYYFIAICTLIFQGCNSDDENISKPIEPTPNSQSELKLHENVIIVDSTKNHLESSEIQISEGLYLFSGANMVDVKEGTVIVGDQGNGFIKKVINIKINGDLTTLETQPASLDEVFKSGILEINLNDDYLKNQSRLKEKNNYTFGEYNLYESPEARVKLSGGNLDYNFNWKYIINFNERNFKITNKDSYLNSNFSFDLDGKLKIKLPAESFILKKFPDLKYVIPVPIGPFVLPIVVTLSNQLDFEHEGNIEGKFSSNLTFSSSNKMDLTVEYESNEFNSLIVFNTDNNLIVTKSVAVISTELSGFLVLNTSFLIQGLVGPNLKNGVKVNSKTEVSSKGNWKLEANGNLESRIGLIGKTFFKSLENYSKSFKSDSLTYITPFQIQRISGDNQIGQKNKFLSEPLKVKVLDNFGKPESGVPVYFKPNVSHGVSVPDEVFTDENGIASALWQLGDDNTTIQYIDIFAQTADDTNIKDSPLTFAAVLGFKIEIQKGDQEYIDENNEVEVIIKVLNSNNEPEKNIEVLVYSSNPHLIFNPSAPYISNDSGLIQFKIKVKPENSDNTIIVLTKIIDDEGQNLAENQFEIFTNPIIGTWKLESYNNGSSLGEAVLKYDDDCPNIATGSGTYYGITWSFTNNSYERLIDESSVDYNLGIDKNCNIYYDGPDNSLPRVIDDYYGPYTFTNNILTLFGDLEGSIPINFLNESKTRFEIGDENYNEIYVKQ